MYNNYGALVFKDDLRRPDREDVAVFEDDEKEVLSSERIAANIRRNLGRVFATAQGRWAAHAHHAVLGDGPVRLCVYKARVELWELGADGPQLVPLIENNINEWEFCGEYKGCRYRVFDIDDDGIVELDFIEPDGAHWTAGCGFLYGAGHTDATHAGQVC